MKTYRYIVAGFLSLFSLACVSIAALAAPSSAHFERGFAPPVSPYDIDLKLDDPQAIQTFTVIGYGLTSLDTAYAHPRAFWQLPALKFDIGQEIERRTLAQIAVKSSRVHVTLKEAGFGFTSAE